MTQRFSSLWTILCCVSLLVLAGCPGPAEKPTGGPAAPPSPQAQTPPEEPVAPPGPALEGPKLAQPAAGEPKPAGAAAEPKPAEAQPKPAEAQPKPAAEPAAAAPLKKSSMLIRLPEDLCNTPDAMCLLPDGSFILSVPNFNDQSQPSLMMKITKDNKAEKFCDLPANADTGKPFGPLGVCLAPNGDLFVADYQMSAEHKSRVARIVVKDGKATGVVPVVTGFNVSNGMIVRDGCLWVTETQIDAKAKPAVSGVFRFTLEELQGTEPVKLKAPGTDDPHLVGTIQCFDQELPLGADGITFDKEGNLYVSCFADGTVFKMELGPDGKAKSTSLFAKAPFMKSADGMVTDPRDGKIYVADSRANAIQVISPDGSVKTLAQNGDTDGLDGGMDQPCEPLLRGNELIVSNMDWPVPGCINQKYNKPATLSVIKLD